MPSQHPDSLIIDRLGGTNRVATLCHVRPPSVSAWRIYGIPEARRMYLEVAFPAAFVEPEPAEEETGPCP